MIRFIREIIVGLESQYCQQLEVSKETEVDFVNLIPQDSSREIFSYLNSQELARCFRINKTWKALASEETLWNDLTQRIAFGKKFGKHILETLE